MKQFLCARKSTDDNGHQLLSIDTQLTELRHFAKQQRFRVVTELVESQTTRKPGRPGRTGVRALGHFRHREAW